MTKKELKEHIEKAFNAGFFVGSEITVPGGIAISYKKLGSVSQIISEMYYDTVNGKADHKISELVEKSMEILGVEEQFEIPKPKYKIGDVVVVKANEYHINTYNQRIIYFAEYIPSEHETWLYHTHIYIPRELKELDLEGSEIIKHTQTEDIMFLYFENEIIYKLN